MQTYELTYIVSSAIMLEQAEELRKELEVFLQSKEGVIVKSEKASAKTLSYPIKKQTSGYFITLDVQLPADKVKELKERLEKNTNVLRHIILVKSTKIRKEKRMRKPLKPLGFDTKGKTHTEHVEIEDKKKGEKVELEEINKKLDEILSE